MYVGEQLTPDCDLYGSLPPRTSAGSFHRRAGAAIGAEIERLRRAGVVSPVEGANEQRAATAEEQGPAREPPVVEKRAVETQTPGQLGVRERREIDQIVRIRYPDRSGEFTRYSESGAEAEAFGLGGCDAMQVAGAIDAEGKMQVALLFAEFERKLTLTKEKLGLYAQWQMLGESQRDAASAMGRHGQGRC